MKKIIAVFDGLKYSESTQAYTVRMAQRLSAHVVAIFLDDREYHGYKIYDLITDEGVSGKVKNKLDEKDNLMRKSSAQQLEAVLHKAKIPFTLRHDKGNALQDLIHESLFTDLLILFNGETFTPYEEKTPTRFVRHLLEDVHCPVLLVPSSYVPMETVIWMYDGAPSSINAIKMFNYLFGPCDDFNIELLSIKPEFESLHLPDHRLIKEYVKRHAAKANLKILSGDTQDELIDYLKSHVAGTLIVLGAYHRSKWSRWVHESMADTLLKKFQFPLFIAHPK